jgi:antirestriction protein ArdC
MDPIPEPESKAAAPESRARARGEAARRGRAPARAAKRAQKPARAIARAKGRAADLGAPRVSLYDEVTARIVAELEAGRFPWVQPWDASAFAPGLPCNADSRRAYSGINILILWDAAMRQGFASQGWLTFRQAQQAGGQVRRGEKGTTIFYAARFTPTGGAGGESGGAVEGPKESSGRAARGDAGGGQESEDDRSVPFLKRFTVFNVAQVDGLPERCTVSDMPLAPRETVPIAEALLAASGADIRIGGNEAYYSPPGDYVALPPQQAFFEQIDYYRTALHELGHWTGHASRLDRLPPGAFGSAAYGREELCAELASAFLCAALGIRPTVRHADYLGAWLAILRTDTRAIFKAASLASKAADYLLAFVPDAARNAAPAPAPVPVPAPMPVPASACAPASRGARGADAARTGAGQ